ncbi:MAG: hypothetical protein KJZ74_15770 [Gemmatimonadales bacterium]|nr:hypothetical protein [Gemmatimonadales bacterium]
MSTSRIHRTTVAMFLACVLLGPQSVRAQGDPVTAELDAFWAGVVRSVTDWSIPAQKATYHPDAVGVTGTRSSYKTYHLWSEFAAKEADPAEMSAPPKSRILEFRFSSRVHDATTAHEVGLYHYWEEGQDHYYGTVDSYLVRKDGLWRILVEIQLELAMTEADWNALRP